MILPTPLLTTQMLGQRCKLWPNIVSTLGQCFVFLWEVGTVHAVDPALALVAVVCSFTASVAATIKVILKYS